MPELGPVPAEAATWLVLALVVSALGWLRTVWFVSLGYAFSVVGIAGLAAWQFRSDLTPLAALQTALLAAYGLRLGIFLVRREKVPSYRKELAEAEARSAGIGPAVKGLIWAAVAVLYVLMCSPALFNLVALRAGDAVPSLAPGLALMGGGLLLEAWADRQKSAYKAAHPGRFCDVKLYRLVRCPNYLGEVVFWLGQWIAGASALRHWSHWTMTGVGFVCILLIMVGSARRLELSQDERYGEREDYRAYCARVPILFPFVPVYSLRNWKVYLG